MKIIMIIELDVMEIMIIQLDVMKIIMVIQLVIDSCHNRVIRNQQNLYPKFLLLP